MSDTRAASPGEFRFPGHVLDASPGPARPRLRPPAPPGSPVLPGSRRRPQPAVLLLSRVRDEELGGVQSLLGRAGIPSLRLDADELADAGLVLDPDARVLRAHGGWITPTVSWVRHFSAQAIAGGGDPEQDLFLRESWQAAIAALAASAATRIAPEEPYGVAAQLRIAARHGIAVPRTIVTTDLAEARDAFRCRRLVVKAAHRHFTEAAPGRLTGRFPTVVERRRLSGRVGGGVPVIVQEYVEHDAELRVYYLNGRIEGFEVDKESAAELWTAPDRIGVRHVTPPAAVDAATRRLAAAMSLRYGAFDFLVRPGGPVFLEANPDGDWRWAELRAKTGAVTSGVARMLADLHRAALSGGARAAPLDLLSFLTAGATPKVPGGG